MTLISWYTAKLTISCVCHKKWCMIQKRQSRWSVWVWPERLDINSFSLCSAVISFPIWNLLVKGSQSLHPLFISPGQADTQNFLCCSACMKITFKMQITQKCKLSYRCAALLQSCLSTWRMTRFSSQSNRLWGPNYSEAFQVSNSWMCLNKDVFESVVNWISAQLTVLSI